MTKLYTFGEMKQLLNANAENISENNLVKGFSIDSRTLKDGDLFFCIKGENTDGHHYIPQALEKGACGIVAIPENIPQTLRNRNLPCILVSDPNKALREWAADVRRQFSGKVLAITGSNGKTSTKDILAGLCRYIDPQAYSTPGNYNNFIGVPLTILSAVQEAKWWIIEIGTNQFGEIAELSNIVQPTAGIITNIGESHLEFLGSTAGVAKEKSGLFAGMNPESNVVIPDSLLHQQIVEEAAAKAGVSIIKTAQLSEKSPAGLNKFRLFEEEFETSIDSPLLKQNLILALTLLHLEGVAVSELQIASSSLDLSVKGRFQQINMDDWILIDDTYNANPSSFQSVLENLNKMFPERRKIVVCGAMAELGDSSPEFHRQVGNTMFNRGVEKMYGLGGEEIEFYLEGWKNAGGEKTAARHFNELAELLPAFKAELQSKDVVLVKGSRSAKMERFVDAML
ncbi:MAG: UDP-N-acetylmuramoyl-tripeptide--D-alanyl-D-alanine ligase [SAR324 cluster bacterium]|nr:UDP-N-acetylmuramoyl-tripeptide--D-alanyl-D-alanine ligase [SAR324 cluster bacterium]